MAILDWPTSAYPANAVSFKNSDGSPNQQESAAKREHDETGPIRFDPKAAGRS
jgi:hypothetical protein